MGRCIELVYTPMRKDGTRGNPKSIQSDVIVPGKLTYFEDFTDSCIVWIINLFKLF